jgi:hypothetical protein
MLLLWCVYRNTETSVLVLIVSYVQLLIVCTYVHKKIITFDIISGQLLFSSLVKKKITWPISHLSNLAFQYNSLELNLIYLECYKHSFKLESILNLESLE